MWWWLWGGSCGGGGEVGVVVVVVVVVVMVGDGDDCDSCEDNVSLYVVVLLGAVLLGVVVM